MCVNLNSYTYTIDKDYKNIASYSEVLAKYYGLVEEEISLIKEAVSLYNIGKIDSLDIILEKIDRFDTILNKQNILTPEEDEFIKTHLNLEYNMLKQFNKQFKLIASNIAFERHERYDGKGYPMGLKNEEISIHGRITALAIYIDILGKNKSSWDNQKIFEVITNEKGKHFDPKLVDIFFDNLEEFFEVKEEYNNIV